MIIDLSMELEAFLNDTGTSLVAMNCGVPGQEAEGVR
jgi:hypothetical protein